MQINEIIRKYRKEKGMTQEEMAGRLGVTAPAVNKWESGASMPDIALLAPIARLLGISLDELLSFNGNLSDVETANIVNEIMMMFNTEPFDTVFQKMVDVVSEYPNADDLILSLAAILYSRCILNGVEKTDEYDKWIKNCYENLLKSDNEATRLQAADGLYAFYVSKEQYGEAEKCLDYYSADNPVRKRKLATIYSGTGRYEEAYKALEESMFSDYQRMSVTLHEIYMVAVKTGDFKKAKTLIDKESALSTLFEMGPYHENAGRFDYAVATKDCEKTLEIMDLLLSHTDTLMDYTKSGLYEHMTFKDVSPMMFSVTHNNMLNQFCENDAYSFVRETPEWEAFKEKWCKDRTN